MGGTIKAISQGVSSVGNTLGGKNPFGQSLGNYFQGAAIAGPVGGLVNSMTNSNPAQPAAPGTNQNLQNVYNQQTTNATNFRNNLGGYENQMYNQYAQGAAGKMGSDLDAVKSNNAARGMGYGGVNAGQQQGVRSQYAQQGANARSQINQQANAQANQMDNEAIQTGIAIQSSSQQQQDMIYKMAMTNMQSQNSIFGGAMGLMGSIGGAAAGGG